MRTECTHLVHGGPGTVHGHDAIEILQNVQDATVSFLQLFLVQAAHAGVCVGGRGEDAFFFLNMHALGRRGVNKAVNTKKKTHASDR